MQNRYRARAKKMLIIHTGTNDLPDDMNSIKKLKKVVQSIHDIDVNQEIKVAFFGIINREDNNFAEKIKDRNTKLESYCKSKSFAFINNSKLDSSSLNRGRLYLNRKGTGLLCTNFVNCVKTFWVPRERVVYKGNISDLADKSNIGKLKELRLNNPKNILFAYVNINSIRNKFKNFCSLLADKIDIHTIAETKLDGSFPTNQFMIKGS